MKTITEGPEEGPESAAAYKADTPGQENAANVPYGDRDDIVNDDIQKMIAAVSAKMLGLKESVVRYGTKWSIIKEFLELHGTDGINKLVEYCVELNRKTGKPLRQIIPESVNPDEFIDDDPESWHHKHTHKEDVNEEFSNLFKGTDK